MAMLHGLGTDARMIRQLVEIWPRIFRPHKHCLTATTAGSYLLDETRRSYSRVGAAKQCGYRRTNHRQLDLFLLSLPVLPYAGDCARPCGEIRRPVEVTGTPIGSMDMLIAAHGGAADLSGVTHNTGEFDRVPGLIGCFIGIGILAAGKSSSRAYRKLQQATAHRKKQARLRRNSPGNGRRFRRNGSRNSSRCAARRM